MMFFFFFFFSSRRRHTRFDCDWSSDVCSSDLGARPDRATRAGGPRSGDGRARAHSAERRPRARAHDSHVRRRRRRDPPLGRRRHRLGLRPRRGGRGVVGEGPSAAGGDRRPARGARVVTLVALAQLGRGVVAVDEPVVHADDEGLLRGRSVFETLRVYAGAPFKLDAHLDRLAASAERLRLPEPPHDALAAIAQEAIAAGVHPDATLRLLWTAGRAGGAPAGLVLVSTLPPD